MKQAPEKKVLHLNALILFIVTCTAVSAVYVVESLLKEKIVYNENLSARKMIEGLMPYPYDNDLLEDKIAITLPAYFGAGEKATVYRAMLDGEPVGVIFSPVKARGYNATIDIAMGVKQDGVITGVRILEHRETEGLGDKIDQNQSDWIFGFDGRSLANTEKAQWAVKKEGGDFDGISGATTSSRAVIQAVEYTLNYYAVNKERLY